MNEEEKKLPEESMETAPSDPFDQAVPEEEGPGGEKDIVPEQGLDLDNYEKTEPFVKGERVEDSIAGIPITYDLTPDEVTRALKYFQKKTIYKKNLIFTGILGIIVILYVQAVITDPSYALGYILGFLALTVIGFMWYLPALSLIHICWKQKRIRIYRLQIRGKQYQSQRVFHQALQPSFYLWAQRIRQDPSAHGHQK